MERSQLDALVDSVLAADRGYAVRHTLQQARVTPSLPELPSFSRTYSNVPLASFSYSTNPHESYSCTRDGLYVHIPSFVKVHRAPRDSFGPNLFGLAIPSTGDVFVRDDLYGDMYLEVLHHEVGHVVDPNRSENENRAITSATFGDRGRIHQQLGRANY